MSAKKDRRAKIVSKVEGGTVSTQEELLKSLKKEGVTCTQATLSRDIKELGIVLVPSQAGHKYQLMGSLVPPMNMDTLAGKFSSSATGVRHAGNLVVVRTTPGEASGLARLIDGMNMKEVLGTIAGDDTFLVVVDDKKSVPKVLAIIEKGMNL